MSYADKAWLNFKIAMSNQEAVARYEKKLSTNPWSRKNLKGGKIC